MLTLNQQQMNAVLNTKSNTLIIAGAGTGKTRVITSKIIHLMRKEKVYAHNILAITFTNKAANEMKQRIADILPNQFPMVKTFHAFGAILLRQFIVSYKNYNNNFTILDENDKKSVLKQLNPKFAKKEVSSLIFMFSQWKNDFLYPENSNEQEMNMYYCPVGTELAIEYYQKYQEYLERYNMIDFDDLIALPIFLLDKSFPYYNENCYNYVSRRFKYVFIDEYQDTNSTQEKLLSIFYSMKSILTAVGDNDQSIYGFRGARIENILNFKEKYKPLNVYVLEQNYRSTQSILNVANVAITQNQNIFPKELFSENDIGEKPTWQIFFSEYDEAEFVIQQIKRAIQNGTPKKEIAILYRTNYQSIALEQSLTKNDIAYEIIGGIRFYQRKEIKDLLSYLVLLANGRDIEAFKRALTFPTRGIGKKSIEAISHFIDDLVLKREEKQVETKAETIGEENQNDIIKLLVGKDFSKILSKKAAIALKELIEWLQQVRQDMEQKINLPHLIRNVYQQSGLQDAFENIKDPFERDQRIGNIEFFFSYVDKIYSLQDDISLVEFLEKVLLNTDEEDKQQDKQQGEKTNNQDKVNLLTVHNAKGLEYSIVFIIGLVEEIFPHTLSLQEENEEEERRLFYVAVTRAKKQLYLSSTERTRNQYIAPSRFVYEIKDEIDGEKQLLDVMD